MGGQGKRRRKLGFAAAIWPAVAGLALWSACFGSRSERPDDAAQPGETADSGEDAPTDAEPICGNGNAEEGEECDGTDLRGRTCASFGFSAGMIVCDGDCGVDLGGCRNPACGDGICDLHEDPASCAADCRPPCGDGSCGEDEDQLACPADCGAVARTACPRPRAEPEVCRD